MSCGFDLDHYLELLEAAAGGGYRFARFDAEPQPGDLFLRHDVDLSLEAALAMARLEREHDAYATYFLMTESVFYNLDSELGRSTVGELRGLGHAVALHAVYPRASHDERFDAVVAWHNPDAAYVNEPVSGFVNVMQPPWFTKGRYRSDSNQRWREGCPHEELRAGAFEWLQLLVHPEIWVYPGATMGETMRAMVDAKRAELFKARPDLGAVGRHAVVPGFQGTGSVLLAVGILGATVMPHVIWLHSALTQSRIRPENDAQARRLMRLTKVDIGIAMAIAGLINAAMLVMAASTFFKSGLHDVGSLEGAHKTLVPLLGGASSTLFAVALLFSGLSSSAVGTLAGQVVMQGFIRRQIPIGVRRLVTMAPAFVVIGLGADPSRTLVISQVALSFGIPFALVPLVRFTSSRELMGALVNAKATTVAAALVAGLIISLNVFLLVQTFRP